MKSFKLLLASLAFSFVLFTGCQKDIKTEPTATAPELQQAGAVKKTTDVTEASKEKLTKLIASLPAGAKEKLAKKVALTVQAHPQYRALVLKALHATDPSTCNDYTAISQWLNGELSDWTYDAIINVLSLAMLDLPQDYALLFQNSSENQYYGVDGEFTHQVTKTFKDIKRFWNIQSDDIVLAAMHGNIMQDRDKVIKTYMY
ncbi:MAG TPA: hypothetical protein VM010_01145 [Chitinophagaceae bacterium]|nr:hypothetical protein [Chitinophagaceae bacterium]